MLLFAYVAHLRVFTLLNKGILFVSSDVFLVFHGGFRKIGVIMFLMIVVCKTCNCLLGASGILIVRFGAILHFKDHY